MNRKNNDEITYFSSIIAVLALAQAEVEANGMEPIVRYGMETKGVGGGLFGMCIWRNRYLAFWFSGGIVPLWENERGF